ncbi:MAG: hypothetical protein WA765_00700 [Candidatus Acidiferrum sp.]
MRKANAQRVRFCLAFIFALILAGCILSSFTSLAGQSSKPASCSAPEYHQFDFWLGDWDSFDIGTTKKDAHIRVNRILDGCVIHEDYQGLSGHQGESFSIYDATRKLWHQTWVTNHGELLIIEGKFQSGEMVLSGSDLTSTGEKREVRGVWKPLPDGSVRETAVISFDFGKSWRPWFDLIFRSHTP